jgi:hypothetical protein
MLMQTWTTNLCQLIVCYNNDKLDDSVWDFDPNCLMLDDKVEEDAVEGMEKSTANWLTALDPAVNGR